MRVRRTLSFGRFDLCGSVTLRDGSRCEIVEHPARLLDLLSDLPGYDSVVRDLAGEARLARFRLEVRNSAANYALALAGASLRRRELAARTRGSGTHLAGVGTRADRGGRDVQPAGLLRAVGSGRAPAPPGREAQAGPWCGGRHPALPGVGSAPGGGARSGRKRMLQGCFPGRARLTGVLYGEYQGLRQQVANALWEKGLDADDYGLIVVHPWQFEHVLTRLYAKAMESGEVVPLGAYASLREHSCRSDAGASPKAG